MRRQVLTEHLIHMQHDFFQVPKIADDGKRLIARCSALVLDLIQAAVHPKAATQISI